MSATLLPRARQLDAHHVFGANPRIELIGGQVPERKRGLFQRKAFLVRVFRDRRGLRAAGLVVCPA